MSPQPRHCRRRRQSSLLPTPRQATVLLRWSTATCPRPLQSSCLPSPNRRLARSRKGRLRRRGRRRIAAQPVTPPHPVGRRPIHPIVRPPTALTSESPTQPPGRQARAITRPEICKAAQNPPRQNPEIPNRLTKCGFRRRSCGLDAAISRARDDGHPAGSGDLRSPARRCQQHGNWLHEFHRAARDCRGSHRQEFVDNSRADRNAIAGQGRISSGVPARRKGCGPGPCSNNRKAAGYSRRPDFGR